MSTQKFKQQVSGIIAKRDFALAEQLCREAENTIPGPELLFIRGVLYSAKGDSEKALSYLLQAYQALPERGDIAYNYGVVLHKSGNIAEAVRAWQRATSLGPDNAAAWINLALGTVQLGNDKAAVEVYRCALQHHPANRDLLYNYANHLYRLGDLTQSEAIYTTLLNIHPKDALAWINLGMVLKAARRFDQAETCLLYAATLGNPANIAHANFNLANLLLQQAKWRDGFAAYEWRLKLPGAISSPWPLPAWNADLPAGSRVLLWNDQGQGDAIMYLRFAPLLAEKGYRVFAFVQDSIRALAATAPSIEAAFSPRDQPQPMDAALPLCSLPHMLGLASVDVGKTPYLRAPENNVFAFGENSASALRVGIVWAGNQKHANDSHRSMRLADFAPLFDLPLVEWFSLQAGPRGAELPASPFCERVRDISASLTDFSATASVLMKLDLLISVDTAPAHVAGALGRPVWTLLPAMGNDWRWGLEGDQTFWYPSMRLFRQSHAGDWGSVIADVAKKLSALREQARSQAV